MTDSLSSLKKYWENFSNCELPQNLLLFFVERKPKKCDRNFSDLKRV